MAPQTFRNNLQYWSDILSGLLMALFTYAALSKMIAGLLFKSQLYSQTFPHALADVLYYLLPVAELLTVVLLFWRRTRLTGYYGAALLLTVFTGYIALVLLRFWGRVPCACGGILNHLGWPAHLGFNLFFLALTIIAIIVEPKVRRAGDKE